MNRNDPLLNYITCLEKALVPERSNKWHDRKKRKGQWNHLSFELPDFIRQIEKLRSLLDRDKKRAEEKQKPIRDKMGRVLYYSDLPFLRFIDVGCGIGTRLRLATELLDCYADGIEIEPAYIKTATRVNNDGNTHIYQANALTYDYKDYDAIYFYRPLRDEEKQDKLEQRILGTAKSGAYILANLPGDDGVFGFWKGKQNGLRLVWGGKTMCDCRIFQKV